MTFATDPTGHFGSREEMIDRYLTIKRLHARLYAAATALYEAGHWYCDRPVDEGGLWTELRDALGRDPGGVRSRCLPRAKKMADPMSFGLTPCPHKWNFNGVVWVCCLCGATVKPYKPRGVNALR